MEMSYKIAYLRKSYRSSSCFLRKNTHTHAKVSNITYLKIKNVNTDLNTWGIHYNK